MRLVNAFVLLLALGLCFGAAYADPINSGDPGTIESIWITDRATYPEAEPNNPCPTSQAVALGDIVDPAVISPAGDFDFYKIHLLTTDRLTVVLDKATGCTVNLDTYIDILRDDCSTVLFSDDDDGPATYSYIKGSEWTPPVDGDYYVKVRGYSASYTGCYKIWFYSGLSGIGACCNGTTGACTLVEPGSCSYVFYGPGTTCTPNPCPQPAVGACCTPGTGACTVVLQSACASPNIWLGPDTNCSPNPCEAPVNDTCAGAITLDRCTTGSVNGNLTFAAGDYNPAVPGPSCTGYAAAGHDIVYKVDLLPGDVIDLTYTENPAYDGSIYVVTDCANVSASCVAGADTYPNPPGETIHFPVLTAGTYFIICDAYSLNAGGTFVLDYTFTCAAPTGACCDHATGACTITEQSACTFDWLGVGVPCDATTCPPPVEPTGACCETATGQCTITTQAACQFTWLGPDIPCDASTCPTPFPTGACCDHATGNCTVTTQIACAFDWLGAGVPCDATTCPPPPPVLGACCDHATGACAVTTQAACTFDWLGEGVPCDLTTCVPPTPTETSSWGRIKNLYR